MSYELKLQEGDPAPAFSAPVNGGGRVALADYAGKNVVLFFLSEGQHARLHEGGLRLSRQSRRAEKERRGGAGREHRSGEGA